MADERVLIEVVDLTKSYGPVQALHGVTFSVAEGEILGFLGPNGAGKSTTLRILAGFLPGDSGTVRVTGHDVGSESLAVRRHVGYLPEGVPLYPDMRVGEYLRFRAELKGVPRRQRRGLIGEALESTQTVDVRKRIIGTLSRGYRQRVGLADALLSKPPVLILDEPTVGLDPEQVLQFRQLLRDVGSERTVILSTHILSEVEHICSSVVIIAGGKIVARDSADQLRGFVGSEVALVAEIAATGGVSGGDGVTGGEGAKGGKESVRARLESLDGVTRVKIEKLKDGGYSRYRLDVVDADVSAEAVFRTVANAGWKLRLLERRVQSMEDIFLDAVGRHS